MSDAKIQATILRVGEDADGIAHHQDIVATVCANHNSFVDIGAPGVVMDTDAMLAAHEQKCASTTEPGDFYPLIRSFRYQEDFGMMTLDVECTSGEKFTNHRDVKFPYKDANEVAGVMGAMARETNKRCRGKESM